MRIIKLIACVIVCLIFCSCTGAQAVDYDITDYLNSFTAMDFKTMYSFVKAPDGIDETAFIQKYNDIFTGLGVEQIVIENLSEPGETGEFAYTATYKTKEYGDFTNVFKLKTTLDKNECFVAWDYSLIFPEMEKGSRVRVQTLNAARGEIFAADGTILAANAYADTIYMDTSKVQNIASVTEAVCPIIGKTNTQVVQMFNDALEDEIQIVTLGAFFADELTDEQKQNILGVPGLGIDDKMYTPIRDYPLGEYAAHILGYTGYYEQDALPEGYTIYDKAGLSGLEAAYETQLRGADGKIIYIEDRWGSNIKTLYEVPLKQGEDLRLALKTELQKDAYNALRCYLEKGEMGAVVVMDASTGYVEAITSYPSYDNNLFTFGISDEVWESLTSSESKDPLFARATQGQYPPGSAFKPFTATAALEDGAISPETAFTGQINDNVWVPDDEGWYWKGITRIDDSAGSPLKLHNALVSSDNIFFAFAALKLGESPFMEYMQRIGMEQAVPFDLPVKKANLVKTTTQLDKWLLATMGYGQGELLVTPLQLASMYTAFANGTGDMLEPILVQKLCRQNGLEYDVVSEKQTSVWVENGVPSRSLNILQPILRDVIENGTGRAARISGVDIAGKTGTAEIGDDKSREISWFVAYWENQDYDRLVVVMVDTAAQEGAVKFDIAKELLDPQSHSDESEPEPDEEQ